VVLHSFSTSPNWRQRTTVLNVWDVDRQTSGRSDGRTDGQDPQCGLFKTDGRIKWQQIRLIMYVAQLLSLKLCIFKVKVWYLAQR